MRGDYSIATNTTRRALTQSSTPHNGAGAGVAVEDAAVLSRLLGALEHPDPSALAAAFKTYDAVRLTRTQKLVTASRDAALLYEFQKPGILDDMEKVKADLQERYKWLWEFDMEQHCQQAVRKFRDAGSKL